MGILGWVDLVDSVFPQSGAVMEDCKGRQETKAPEYGFTEVIDFEEPQFDLGASRKVEDLPEVSKAQRKPVSFQDKFLSNLARALGIYAIVNVLALAMILFGTFGLFACIVVGLGGYIFCGYRYLIPLQKMTFLSLLSPAVLLIASVGILGHIFPSVSLLNALNIPAIAYVDISLGLFLDTGPIEAYQHLFPLVAAPIPSLLMYLGLRVRVLL
jgi:hypothetical protein